jgi:hypothetical protein
MEEKKLRTVRAVRVEFDSSKKIRENQDELVVPAVLTRESILPFADGLGYRPAAELAAAAWTLEGAWVVAYSHIVTVFPMSREDVRGRVKDIVFDAEIQGVRGDIHFQKALCDEALLSDVRGGGLKDVSVAYFCEDVFEPGEFAGERYDFRQENFMFGHVAAGVPEGRCPSPFCGMNVDSFKPHLDPEVTEKYVRIRVKDPDLFVDGSFRTVVLSADQGIHAVAGKLKSSPSGSTVVQNYMFELAKGWTLDKSEAWVKAHKDEALPLEGGQPKTDRERFMAHFNVTAEVFQKLYDVLGDKLFDLLPDRGQKIQQQSTSEGSDVRGNASGSPEDHQRVTSGSWEGLQRVTSRT